MSRETPPPSPRTRTALEQSRLDEPLKFPPVGNFSNKDIGNLGTVIHETARELARVRLQLFSTGEPTVAGLIYIYIHNCQLKYKDWK